MKTGRLKEEKDNASGSVQEGTLGAKRLAGSVEKSKQDFQSSVHDDGVPPGERQRN